MTFTIMGLRDIYYIIYQRLSQLRYKYSTRDIQACTISSLLTKILSQGLKEG